MLGVVTPRQAPVQFFLSPVSSLQFSLLVTLIMMSLHPDTCALRMAQVRSEKDHHLSWYGASVLTHEIRALPVEQAHQRLGIAEGNIHELQEQLQRVSAGHQATHQLLSIFRSKVDTRSSVRLVVSKTLMADRFGKKNGPIWITWSYLARDFVGVVHATLKQAMKAAKNKKQPISVTHLQHEFNVTSEMDHELQHFFFIENRRRSSGNRPWS